MNRSRRFRLLSHASRYCLVGMVSVVVWAGPLASVSLASGYVPPNSSSPGGPTGSTGHRGGPIVNPGSQPPTSSMPLGPTDLGGRQAACGEAGGAPLAILAPVGHVGQTISTHPTFFWYGLQSETQTIEFRLYQVTDNGDYRHLKQELLATTPGLMQYTLPSSEPGLVQGTRYMWQILIPCDPDRPSRDVILEAYVDVVPATVPATNAEQLAHAGLWYDAFAVALSHAANGYWLELLSTLAETEPPTVDAPLMSQRDRLQRVIDRER